MTNQPRVSEMTAHDRTTLRYMREACEARLSLPIDAPGANLHMALGVTTESAVLALRWAEWAEAELTALRAELVTVKARSASLRKALEAEQSDASDMARGLTEALRDKKRAEEALATVTRQKEEAERQAEALTKERDKYLGNVNEVAAVLATGHNAPTNVGN